MILLYDSFERYHPIIYFILHELLRFKSSVSNRIEDLKMQKTDSIDYLERDQPAIRNRVL